MPVFRCTEFSLPFSSLCWSCITFSSLATDKTRTDNLNQTASFWVASAKGAEFHPQEQDKQHHGLRNVLLLTMSEYLKNKRSGSAVQVLSDALLQDSNVQVCH